MVPKKFCDQQVILVKLITQVFPVTILDFNDLKVAESCS